MIERKKRRQYFYFISKDNSIDDCIKKMKKTYRGQNISYNRRNRPKKSRFEIKYQHETNSHLQWHWEIAWNQQTQHLGCSGFDKSHIFDRMEWLGPKIRLQKNEIISMIIFFRATPH
jgi:hypothetical protein